MFRNLTVKLKKWKEYKIRRIPKEDSVREHQRFVPPLWDTKVTSLEVFNRCC